MDRFCDRPHIKSFLGYNAACATAVVDETDAAVAVMAELLVGFGTISSCFD